MIRPSNHAVIRGMTRQIHELRVTKREWMRCHPRTELELSLEPMPSPLHRTAHPRRYIADTSTFIQTQGFFRIRHPDRRHFRFKEQPHVATPHVRHLPCRMRCARFLRLRKWVRAQSAVRREQRRPRDEADYVRRDRLSGSARLRRRRVHHVGHLRQRDLREYPRQLRWRHSQGDVSNSLLQLILSQSQTFPNVSTASGFTFQIGGGDNVELESRLYGPLFGERALTNGNGPVERDLQCATNSAFRA